MVVVRKIPRNQVSRRSVTKRRRSKIIRVAIRSGAVIHPEVEHPVNYRNTNNYLSQSSRNGTNSTFDNTNTTSNYQFIKKANSSHDRLGPIDNNHRTQRKKKKAICTKRCVITIILCVLLLIVIIAVIIPVVMLVKTTKTSNLTAILRWNSTGTTVAGITNSPGSNASQLYAPYGLALDSSGSLYIADYFNNRVQKWTVGASTGVTVAGQMNGTYGNGSSYLHSPVGILLDSNDNLYIVDRINQRVQFWPNGASAGSIIAGITDIAGTSNNTLCNPSQIVGDPSTGIFYITDTSNNRVMQYLFNASSGTVVAGGNGQGSNDTQLNYPIGMYFDVLSNSLLIVNYYGHNVVRWTLGNIYWTLVAGDMNGVNGSTSVLLSNPVGITLDPMGNVYVADSNNQRIQLFLNGQSTGVTIAGVTGVFGSNSTLLNNPFWTLLDNQLNLYVSDFSNYRVQKFNRY